MTAVAPSQQAKLSDRVWDIATKLLVPLCFVLGSAVIKHEIELNRAIDRIDRAEKDLNEVGKKLDKIVNGIDDLRDRIIRLETKVEQQQHR